MLRPNSILYHCNDSTRCQKFLQDHTYVIESQEDGIWLGSGMYFWDNATNANYWLKQKSRKQPEEKFEIVIAHVYMDQLKVNAPSLLLGYMRPLISNITNSSQYPTFNIPFLDMQENEAIFEEE